MLLCLLFSFAAHPQDALPKRVVSLSPAVTRQQYLLGAEDRLVGCTVYCTKPEAAQYKEKIGTLMDVNLEKIIYLNPDLVIATSLTDHNTVQKLQDLGIEVKIFPAPKNYSQICEQFLRLGKILGRGKEAEHIVKLSDMRLKKTKESGKDFKKPTVFIQAGSKPLTTLTKDFFVNDIIEFAGGINIAKDLTSGLYSREKVLKDNPDVIIIMTMGIDGQEEKDTWQRFKTLNAVKTNNIYVVDARELGSPTPLSFVEMVEKTEKFFRSTSVNK
ncbi:MAG: ABC transporter substrate-binding protein [Candidatus Omnitrophota bacterium]